MRHLGIDYGTKRIGVAVSDEAGIMAFPLGTVEAGPGALSAIADMVKENGAQKIVIGESRDFSGEANPIMEDIEQFKKDIEELTGVSTDYEQEFFTSALAARQFAPDGSRKQNLSHEKLDAAAAALILQSYLDRNRPAL